MARWKTVKKIKSRMRNAPFQRFMIFIALVSGILVWLFWGLPLPTNLGSKNIPVSTKLFDRNGKLIYEIYTDKRRTPIKLTDLPPYVKEATISIEDKDFYKHYGYSITGMARAAYNIIFKGKLQGGSTLTQQLVKNALLTPERTVKRKIREFVLTFVVEAFYKKDQILEMYLNQIPYGSTAYGVEAASELYLGKEAKDLTLAEAAFLAGLPAAPTRYSPFGSHPELAKERQETVLRRMVEDKYISQEEADEAKNQELKFAEISPPKAPHFALWVKEQLAEKYGEALVEQGGLRVYTTLDLDLQNFAQTAVATEVAKLKKQKVGNGAVIVTKPKTGEILAMVGSKDYFAEDEDGKVNVILAKRQPGSSIKPLNYALAIKDEKITAATTLADVPTCFSVIGQPIYCPVNYDGTYHGLTQARFALGNSYNLPAVKVLVLNRVDNFVEFAKTLGITTFTDPSDYGLSLTLGGGEVRPFDMAEAFGVFANGGLKVPLISILKVTDWRGKVLEETKVDEIEGDRVVSDEVAFIISHILHDNNARSTAFGQSSYLNVSGHPEVSVKTGTTNDRRDNWTDGYTADIVVITWVGNNDNSPMSGAVSGVSGASPIWNKVMKFALDHFEEDGHSWPKQPTGVVGANVCADIGGIPSGPTENPGCQTRFEYFLEGTVPQASPIVNQDVQIDKTTQMLANPKTLPENIETQNKPIFTDPLGALFCLTCPVPTEPVTIRYPLSR